MAHLCLNALSLDYKAINQGAEIPSNIKGSPLKCKPKAAFNNLHHRYLSPLFYSITKVALVVKRYLAHCGSYLQKFICDRPLWGQHTVGLFWAEGFI